MTETQSKNHSVWTFYLLAFGWSWLFWVPLALAEQGIVSLPENLPGFLAGGNLAAWGPLLASLLLTYLKAGWAGIRDLLRQGIRVRFGAFWYAVVLLLFPVVIGGAQLLAQLAGADMPRSPAFAEPVSIPISFVAIFFMGGPLQEEFGWRGYATERLQKKWNALVASIVVGILWAAWHLPLFFIPRQEAYYNRPVWGIFLADVLVTVLLTWVYNNTNKSIFAAMLLHTTFNWSNFLFTGLYTDLGGQIFFGLMIVVVVVVVVIWGPQKLVRET
ncbi:MAG: CPBP family intramembrane metalloprotease [Anaerolineae bacterium]|nr:MAG: CPBP family intramembrane metalloprotease [Anaerolineae bacterium]